MDLATDLPTSTNQAESAPANGTLTRRVRVCLLRLVYLTTPLVIDSLQVGKTWADFNSVKARSSYNDQARQLVRLVISIVIASALCRTSHAALIAEIGINIPPTFDPAPPQIDSVLYQFGVSSLLPTPIGAEWSRLVTVGEVGSTIDATPTMVESFARALMRPTADVTIRVNDTSFSRPLDQLQSGGGGS